MLARLVKPADFERVLGTRSRLTSPHFAVHHLLAGPTIGRASRVRTIELSTGLDTDSSVAVEDSTGIVPSPRIWLGLVVPKRHARRAVTRNLLKRQIRACVGERAGGLAEGLWVVRLRAPFDRERFVSAASDALRRAARDELERLLLQAAMAQPAASR